MENEICDIEGQDIELTDIGDIELTDIEDIEPLELPKYQEFILDFDN